MGGGHLQYTDVTSGALDQPGRGTGGVCGEKWFYMPWSAWVNGGAWKIDGKKVGRKLSAPELVGPLAAMVMFCCRRSWQVLGLAAMLAILSILAAGTRLGVSTDTDAMFSPRLDWRQRAAEILPVDVHLPAAPRRSRLRLTSPTGRAGT